MKLAHFKGILICLTLRANAGEVPPGAVIEGAVKGVQPIVGARKSLIKALSEPFERTVAFLFAAALAGVFWASFFPSMRRYVVSTLSL